MSALHRTSIIASCLALTIASCSGSEDDGAVLTDATVVPTAEPAVTEPEPAATESAATEPPATEPPATEPTDPPATEPLATDPPAPEPATDTGPIEIGTGFGEYPVGVQTITITDTGDTSRDLTVDVWFPLGDLTGIETTPHQYTLIPGAYYESPTALTVDPSAISSDGPFPLVIYSHGSGGIRFIDSNYAEAIASNGYIVAAPDHIGNTVVDRLFQTETAPAETLFNRVNDVERVIDEFLNPQSDSTSPWIAGIRPDQIAVTGHSLGGYTAYAMASGMSNEAGEFVADERVAAIVALAPAMGPALLSDEQLLSISVPTLVVGATNDTTTPIDPNVTRPWNLSASTPSYRVDLVGAEHESFTDICSYQEFLPSLPDVLPLIIDTINARDQAGCDPDDLPIERVQAVVNTFAVALLDEAFTGASPIPADAVAGETDFVYLVAE